MKIISLTEHILPHIVKASLTLGKSMSTFECFDKDLANEIVGKYILIGITYLDSNGDQEEQKQLHGIVKSASEDDGIVINLGGNSEGEEWNMPPDTRSITIAEPGEYRLRSTGEVVINPDYLCSWLIEK